MNTGMKAAGAILLSLGLLAAACSSSEAPSPQPSPEPSPTPSPTATEPPATSTSEAPAAPQAPEVSLKEPATFEPTPTPLWVPTPTPAITFTNGLPDLMTKEQMFSEMVMASFSTGGWQTNFQLRSVPFNEIRSALPKDSIPALHDPPFVSVEEADEWLEDVEPVQVAEINGEVKAYPTRIMMFHEIVNDTVGGEPIAITYCPLCNSAFVYSRVVDGQVLDFGTTGNLRFSNLVMYDRQTESWWQEIGGEAIVGELSGKKLELLPQTIVSWADFKSTFPEGKVMSRDTGYGVPYGENNYCCYEGWGYEGFGDAYAYIGPLHSKLPPLTRIVGISIGDESLAVTYRTLRKQSVAELNFAGQDLVIFHKKGTVSALSSDRIAEGMDVGSAAVFDPHLEGEKLSFTFEDGEFVDGGTGSTWNLFGQATSGPLEGKQLTAVAHRSGQFWFSWAAFRPDTDIYEDK